MADRLIDPARLQGERLTRWYLRTAEDIATEREAADGVSYRAFFGSNRASSPPALGFSTLPEQHTRQGRNPGLHLLPMPAPRPGDEALRSQTLPLPTPRRRDSWIELVPLDARSTGLRQSQAAYQNQAAKPASVGPAAQQPGQPRRASRPDPTRTEVFQRGADGKLHPIPGWHTTGPLDFGTWSKNFDWAGVGRDLAEIGLGASTFMGIGAIASRIVEGAGYKVGQDVVRGILNGHHSMPKFMGGPAKQELAKLHRSIHDMFHNDLANAFKQAGFPRIGGKGGGTDDWAKFLEENAGKREEALGILQKVTREFDARNGTKISRYLDDTPAKVKTPPSGPPKP